MIRPDMLLQPTYLKKSDSADSLKANSEANMTVNDLVWALLWDYDVANGDVEKNANAPLEISRIQSVVVTKDFLYGRLTR